MLTCWRTDADERPSSEDLRTQFQHVILATGYADVINEVGNYQDVF
jgi:hypothetical protein